MGGSAEETPLPPKSFFEAKNVAPDTTKWYRLRKDWPFPVDIGSLFFDHDTGELKGVGIYVRIPLPWEEYLEPWPEGEESGGTTGMD